MSKMALYNKRMLDVQTALKKDKVVSKAEFYISIGFEPFNADKVKKKAMSFTLEQMQKCIDRYKVNPAFFFQPEAKMFL